VRTAGEQPRPAIMYMSSFRTGNGATSRLLRLPAPAR
jgi:hypothetical protein